MHRLFINEGNGFTPHEDLVGLLSSIALPNGYTRYANYSLAMHTRTDIERIERLAGTDRTEVV